MSYTKLKTWLTAIRPKTLPAAAAPVLMGTGMAFGDGLFHGPSALLALIGALTIQIGTNLANDYFDFLNGADTDLRLGPQRVTQAGLISPKSMRGAMILVFSMTVLCSIWLIIRAGWPIAVIALLSILAGIFYTAGPRPLGYLGLGELFVLVFFGPVAVGGTYYVQALEINPAVILAGLACGLFSSAILVVNNLRDIPTDRTCGKKTLAVRFGRDFAQWEYLFCLSAGCLMPVIIYNYTRDHLAVLWSTGVLLICFPPLKRVMGPSKPDELNFSLSYTGLILLVFSIIFSIGWIL